MSELQEKVSKSIERLRAFEPPEGYYLAFSGGKDSVVCKALLDKAGVKYDAHYRVTSVDPPELVRFIKNQHPDVHRDVPRYGTRRGPEWEGKPITMWNLIPWKMMPPTRLSRYCCEHLKESGGDGRLAVTGVRWAESNSRKQNQGIVTVSSKKAAKDLPKDSFFINKSGETVLVNDNNDSRRMVEQCYKRHKTVLNPIIEWGEEDVWDFIKSEDIPYCSLYDEGFRRLGCIGCPLAGTKDRERELLRWPKYRDAYLRTFDFMLKERAKNGRMDGSWRLSTAKDVYNWWMEYDVLPGQFNLFEDYEEDE